LPEDDLKDFLATRAQLDGAVRQFPSLKARAEQTEQDWFNRFMDVTIDRSEKLLVTDPHRASAQLQELDWELQLKHKTWYSRVRVRLHDARRRAARAVLDAGEKECKGLVAKERFQEAAKAGDRLQTTLGNEAKAFGLEEDLNRIRERVEKAGQAWF